jgi:hypothetical protein
VATHPFEIFKVSHWVPLTDFDSHDSAAYLEGFLLLSALVLLSCRSFWKGSASNEALLNAVLLRFASTFHGLDGLVVVNNGLIPEVNVRAALCLFLDWGKVTYVYVEDGVVINSPYRLPTDPSIEVRSSDQ